jgi:CHAT domain-containing protein
LSEVFKKLLKNRFYKPRTHIVFPKICIIAGCNLPNNLQKFKPLSVLRPAHRLSWLISAALVLLLGWAFHNPQEQKEKDELEAWLNAHLDRYSAAETYAEGLAVLDSAITGAWRPVRDSSEADAWYWVHVFRGEALSELGKILASTQAYETARSLYQKYHFNYPGDEYEVTEYLYKPLISQYTKLGDNAKAQVLRYEALKLASRSSMPGLYNNIGLAYWNQGEYLKAVDNYQRGLAVSELLPEQAGLLQLNLAATFHDLQNTQQARQALDAAFAALGKADTSQTVDSYLSAAWALKAEFERQAKNFPKAENALKKALSLAQEASEEIEARELGKMKIQYGQLKFQIGASDQALQLFNEALQVVLPRFKPQKLSDLPQAKDLYEENTIYEALYGKAQALLQNWERDSTQWQQLEQAFQCHLLCQQVELALRNTLEFESSKLQQLGYGRARMEHALKIAQLLEVHRPDQQRLKKAWRMLEQNKAAVLLEAVAHNQLKQAVSSGDELLQKEQKLQKQLAYFETQALTESDSSLANNWLEQSEKTRATLAELRTKLKAKYPAYAQLKKELEEVDFEAAFSVLPKGQESAILEYFSGENDLFLFFWPQNGPAQLFSLGSAAEAEALVKVLLEQVAQKSELLPQAFCDTGSMLSQKLLPAKVREGQFSHLLLIPDAWLNYLPFELLPLQAQKCRNWSQVPWLLRQTEAQYAYSLGVLQAQSQLKTSRSRKILALAPGFEASQRGLPPLRQSEDELASIRGGRKQKLLRQKATWAQFAKAAPHCGILHLCTHAAADSSQAIAGLEFYDRTAFLSDIYALSLRAELTTLSACQTGQGQWQKGEGVMSLARAFAYAGSKGLVATLWSVNENSSTRIFADFYQKLNKGARKSEALNQAKLAYLEHPEVPSFQKAPYYWAAVVYIGADGPLNTSVFPIGSLIVLFLGVLVLYFLFRRVRLLRERKEIR